MKTVNQINTDSSKLHAFKLHSCANIFIQNLKGKELKLQS